MESLYWLDILKKTNNIMEKIIYFDDVPNVFDNVRNFIKQENLIIIKYGFRLNPSNIPTCHRFMLKYIKKEKGL